MTVSKKTSDPEVFFGPDDNGVQVFRTSASGATLNQFGASYLRGVRKFPKATATKGTTVVAGDRAWLIEWTPHLGERSWNLDAIVVRKARPISSST